jgi:hypothetical protein
LPATRRCAILADLAVQPGWLRTYAYPDLTAMADRLITPLLGRDHTLEKAWTCARSNVRQPHYASNAHKRVSQPAGCLENYTAS